MFFALRETKGMDINMSYNVTVSVILPIYNMGEYIANALDSIEQQTLERIEIICIDDGSTDDSWKILNDYERKYANISIYHQENAGSGAARNFGIEKAKGEYVCFLDADDFYVSNDALEYLYYTAKEKKVKICGGSSCDFRNGQLYTQNLRKERRFSTNQYVKSAEYPGMAGYCAFIFQRTFLNEYNIRFPLYLRGQDAPFFVNAIAKAQNVFCCEKTIYAYRKEHKNVIFDLKKAHGLVRSYYDILRTSAEYGMGKVHRCAMREMQGEVGALLYKYAAEGDEEMLQLATEINRVIDKKLLGEETDYILEGEELVTYVQNVKLGKEHLLEQLRNTPYVFIFGAGTVGRNVEEFLKRHGIQVNAFLVTDDKKNAAEVNGIPVRRADSVVYRPNTYIVLVALFWYLQDEVIGMLQNMQVENIVPIDWREFCLWQEVVRH